MTKAARETKKRQPPELNLENKGTKRTTHTGRPRDTNETNKPAIMDFLLSRTVENYNLVTLIYPEKNIVAVLI